MFLEYVILELILVIIAGSSLVGEWKGVLFSGLLMSVLNTVYNYFVPGVFWTWQGLIFIYLLLVLAVNSYLNRKTGNLRLIKVVSGSAVSLTSLILFLPLLPGLFIWMIFIGLPLTFNYRKIPVSFFAQIIFKFIFSLGWIIIGNILYNI